MKNKIDSIYNNLIIKNYHEINDEYGKTKIEIGKNLIQMKLKEQSQVKTIISNAVLPYIRYKQLVDCKVPSVIISIGNFYCHNEAKYLSKMNSSKLILCPVPLSNDSFCTNRFTMEKSASVAYEYPDEIIIDIKLLSKFESNLNILGLGEFIGLYFSIMDYYLSRGFDPPADLLEFLYDLIRSLQILFEGYYEKFIKQLAIALIIKCSIMRFFSDYTIGCGIDHLIAAAIESINKYNHGKSVYLGSIISSVIFTKFNKHNLSTLDLLSFGLKCGILSVKDLDMLKNTNLFFLINDAIAQRPERKTYLSILKNNQIELNNVKIALNNYLQLFSQ